MSYTPPTSLGRGTNTTSLPVAVSTDQLQDGQSFASQTLQSQGNTSLVQIVGNTSNIPAKGSATSANSTPVVIASDQAKVSVQQADTKVTGTISAADTGSTTAAGYANQNVVTGTPTANSFVSLQVAGASSVSIAVGGNLNGTLVFERSIDGIQWAPFSVFSAATPATSTSIVSTGGTTGQGDFHGLIASHSYVRVRATAFTAGSASVAIEAGYATGTVSVNSPIRLLDGSSNTTSTIKAASTAPVAGDTAIVTATSPNSPEVASLSTIATNTTGAATSAKQDTGNASLSTIATNTNGLATASAQTSGNSSLSSIASSNTTVATNTGNIPAKGAATTANSTPVNIASDQTVPVAGSVAAAATDSGNPVKTGGVYNSTLPTLTTGQRGNTQLDPTGKTLVTGGVATGASTAVFPVGVKDGSGNIQQAVQAPQAVNTGGGGLPAAGMIGNYNSTLPSTTSGNYGPIQMDASGRTLVSTGTATGVAAPTTAFLVGASNAEQGNLSPLQTLRANFGDGFGAASQGLIVLNTVWNGSALDRTRGALSDGQAATGILAAGDMQYNGSTWDRKYGNLSSTVKAAGQTATTTTTLSNLNGKNLVVVVNISSFTSGSLTVAISGTTSSGYSYPLLTSAALAATGVTPLRIGVGLTASANAVANDVVPRGISITATVSGTLTYGIDYILGV